MDRREWAKLFSKAIFYASIQASIGSVEMNSRFSVLIFTKDQKTLQRAADALRGYVMVASVWTLGTMLALYGTHGPIGALVGLIANMIMMIWIVISYRKAFEIAAKEHSLNIPTVFTSTDITIGLGALVASITAMCYLNVDQGSDSLDVLNGLW